MEFPMTKAIKLKVDINKESSEIGIFDTKLGGAGFYEKDKGIPTEESGDQLRLLIQVNYSQLRKAVELPTELDDKLPKSGLLQIWVSTDDLAGCDYDNPCNQNGFRVIYYTEEQLVEWQSKSDFKQAEVPTQYADDNMFPVTDNAEYALNYEIVDSENTSDYNELEAKYTDEKEMSQVYNRECGHKIGGYPYFVQYDIREEIENDDHDFLLIQVDSDFINGKDIVLWGEAGCSQFLINSEKLKNLDFSDVIYNWSCS